MSQPSHSTPGARVSVRAPLRLSWSHVAKMSIVKFRPSEQVRNPIMFVVYVFLPFIALLTIFPSWFPDITVGGFDRNYYLGITVILFLTVLFANIAEAIAESQAKAQADSLRGIRTGLRARQVLPDGRRAWIASTQLHSGELVEVRPGEVIPLDGDVVKGAALVDESMMTGESSAGTRESGGDRTSVIGGSRVLDGTVQVRITAEPGTSFLDKMIELVEATRRDKSPNEVSLTLVLVAITGALLVVVVSLAYLLGFLGLGTLNVGTLIALLVCLIPTTIGALLSAIGISGINRAGQANVVSKSGKAIESAGDLDVLILDKTGTITIGNRIAVQFVPSPGIELAEGLTVAATASSLDETPEGRSIARLATSQGARLVPFSPALRMSGLVLPDGTEVMKGALDAIEEYAHGVPDATRELAQIAASRGMTPILIAREHKVIGLVVLKDVLKEGIQARIEELRVMGIRTVMCTGDHRLTAAALAQEAGVDEYVAEARPEAKLEIIAQEKALGRLVAMTGDGTNDAPALARADVGLAMNSGTSAAKEAANMVDLDSDPTKVIEVISIGKQLLITRGALTTFSITNDVAKYFAIIPAMFAASSSVAALNLMQLGDPKLAVLAALLFNALMIPALIPLALWGVAFRPATAVELLFRNLAIYGLGGLVGAFVGIKLLYLLLAAAPPIPWPSLFALAALPWGGA
ncbi:MAG: potassium-transporting ATPase subunit KdpB [Thermoplasmata archaeon]|nr:potassium-transporting ATPase subunit KdpB [Thermoplasmata archaeon]